MATEDVNSQTNLLVSSGEAGQLVTSTCRRKVTTKTLTRPLSRKIHARRATTSREYRNTNSKFLLAAGQEIVEAHRTAPVRRRNVNAKDGKIHNLIGIDCKTADNCCSSQFTIRAVGVLILWRITSSICLRKKLIDY